MGQGMSKVLLSRFDLIIFVFREDKPETERYYESLWGDKPPAPVVIVGNNPTSASTIEEDRLNQEDLGMRLERNMQGGVVCAYFPVSYKDKDTCKELMRFLSLGSWPMRKGAEHVV